MLKTEIFVSRPQCVKIFIQMMIVIPTNISAGSVRKIFVTTKFLFLSGNRTIKNQNSCHLPTDILATPKCPDRLWGPHSLLFRGYGGSFQEEKRPGREVTQLHILPKYRMSGAKPLLPSMSSWREERIHRFKRVRKIAKNDY